MRKLSSTRHTYTNKKCKHCQGKKYRKLKYYYFFQSVLYFFCKNSFWNTVVSVCLNIGHSLFFRVSMIICNWNTGWATTNHYRKKCLHIKVLRVEAYCQVFQMEHTYWMTDTFPWFDTFRLLPLGTCPITNVCYTSYFIRVLGSKNRTGMWSNYTTDSTKR